MASNSFGNLFRVTTWGESHGAAIGCVIDGCPAGIELTEADIQERVDHRVPGRNGFVSQRREDDRVEILSGVFEGKTTGAPICLFIRNKDQRSAHYDALREVLKPGHAQFTYLEKYGIFDHRGGGRASARETACRVAAGAVAQKILQQQGIHIVAYLSSMGSIVTSVTGDISDEQIYANPFFCPDEVASKRMEAQVKALQAEGDSIGGSVAVSIFGCPAGLGDPMYDKLEARLAYAMMGIHASKGFEIGQGYHAATMRGSEHNDSFVQDGGVIKTATNHAGGILGGIATGMPIHMKVFFKPTSSIARTQQTVTVSGDVAAIAQPAEARHDPCVAIRAVPVCLAMAQLVLADAWLMNKMARL